jgi:hypothetical protein
MSATYNRGTAHEVRHTVGTRVFRPIAKGWITTAKPIANGELSDAPLANYPLVIRRSNDRVPRRMRQLPLVARK